MPTESREAKQSIPPPNAARPRRRASQGTSGTNTSSAPQAFDRSDRFHPYNGRERIGQDAPSRRSMAQPPAHPRISSISTGNDQRSTSLQAGAHDPTGRDEQWSRLHEGTANPQPELGNGAISRELNPQRGRSTATHEAAPRDESLPFTPIYSGRPLQPQATTTNYNPIPQSQPSSYAAADVRFRPPEALGSGPVMQQPPARLQQPFHHNQHPGGDTRSSFNQPSLSSALNYPPDQAGTSSMAQSTQRSPQYSYGTTLLPVMSQSQGFLPMQASAQVSPYPGTARPPHPSDYRQIPQGSYSGAPSNFGQGQQSADRFFPPQSPVGLPAMTEIRHSQHYDEQRAAADTTEYQAQPALASIRNERRGHPQYAHHQRAHTLHAHPYQRSAPANHSRSSSSSAVAGSHGSTNQGAALWIPPYEATASNPGLFTNSPTHGPIGHSNLELAQRRDHSLNTHTIPHGLVARSHLPGMMATPAQMPPSPDQPSPVSFYPTHGQIQHSIPQSSPLDPPPAYHPRFGSPEAQEGVVADIRPTSAVHSTPSAHSTFVGDEVPSAFDSPGISAYPRPNTARNAPSEAAPRIESAPENDNETGVESEAFETTGPTPAAGSGRREKRKDPRPHKCPQCGKGFPRPSALATHLSVHSGEKPYNCPVVSCTKTFAVRSNARRHLKTHGIKLKTRDRGSKKTGQTSTSRNRRSSPEDDDEEANGSAPEDDEADDEFPQAPSASRQLSSTVLVNALSKPPDDGLRVAPHRGHAVSLPYFNVHLDPLGLGINAGVSAEHSFGGNTILERVKRDRKTSGNKDRWQVEMSDGIRLRTVRSRKASERSRRGVGTTDEEQDEAVEGEGPGETVHELEEEALLRLCPVEEEPPTPQMPQLNPNDLDKLIAPPAAWDDFHKQKMAQGPKERASVEQQNATRGSAEHILLSSTDASRRESISTLQTSPTMPNGAPSETPEVRCTYPGVSLDTPHPQQERGLPSSSFYWGLGGSGAGIAELNQYPSYSVSSLRTSAQGFDPPAALAPSAGVPSAVQDSPAGRDVLQFHTSPMENAVSIFRGRLREDDTWIPTSIDHFSNSGAFRSEAPFGRQGLSDFYLQVPLPSVQPSLMTGGRTEERDSYADVSANPYHPDHWDTRTGLPGPAPPTRFGIKHMVRGNPIAA